MFFDTTQGAVASMLSVGTAPLPDHQYETVRHLLFGSLGAVRLTIRDLHSRRYAEPNDWSKPLVVQKTPESIAVSGVSKRLD